jgi:hypothetical protein
MNEGGPYTLLFAWEGEIFGEGTAHVTQKVEDTKYNFAFRIEEYEARKPVKLVDLPVPRQPRDLIKLTPEILAAYHKLASANDQRGLSDVVYRLTAKRGRTSRPKPISIP